MPNENHPNTLFSFLNFSMNIVFRDKMDFQEFLRKQEEVYGRFRDTSKLQNEGMIEVICPDGKTPRKSSYYINYKEFKENPARIKIKIK